MLPKTFLAVIATAVSLGTSALALGPSFRIVVQDQLHLPNTVKWYLAPNARRVLGTDKAGVYAFATNTPSGEIFTGGSKLGLETSTSSGPLYPLLKALSGSGVSSSWSVGSTGQLSLKNSAFTQAPGQTAAWIQFPANDFEYHELHAYLGPNNYGDAKLFVEWI